jgi:carotene biosynthesis associated membrane protein
MASRGAALDRASEIDPRPPGWVPVALATATVLAQILYPLTDGSARNRLTVLTVLLFAAASVTAAWRARGVRYAGTLLVVSAGIGFAAEAIGTTTGVPFGDYTYAGSLGPRLFGVPLVIPLAWTMMAYPALLVGCRSAVGSARDATGFVAGTGARIVIGALALASWDVFLDPQMVDAGHWRFEAGNGPALTGIPLVNFAGWLLVALVLMALLSALLPGTARLVGNDRVPLGLYLWTYGSSLLANLVFFGRPEVALTGGVAMGIPVALLVRALRRDRRGELRQDRRR